MRTLTAILLIIITLFSCGQNKNYVKSTSSEYYSNNEDKFGFIVFDRQKIDTFFKKYSPLIFQNVKLKERFINLINADTNFKGENVKFKKNTRHPNASDFNLAIKTIAESKNREKYFIGGLNYLFFFECLPDEFKNKWTQIQLGDFEFNATFFNLLRIKCKVFDEHIYGTTGHWDENIKKLFVNEVDNEITSDKAQQIKNCILQDDAFTDERLQTDRENFVLILDRVIAGKWRLLLYDKN